MDDPLIANELLLMRVRDAAALLQSPPGEPLPESFSQDVLDLLLDIDSVLAHGLADGVMRAHWRKVPLPKRASDESVAGALRWTT